MLEGLLVERWFEWMNVDLNMSKEKCKSASIYIFIKESEHDKDESRR